MASKPDPVDVDANDDEFSKAFAEFAGVEEKTPPAPEPDEQSQPEGNAPEDEASAEEETSKVPDQDPEQAPPAKDAASAKPEEAVPAEAPDPWSAVPPELKAQYEQTVKERDEARYRASSDANRVAALSRKLHALTTGKADEPKPEEKSEAEKALDTQIEKLKEDYGDVATPLIALIEKQAQELKQVRTFVSAMSEDQQAAHVAAELQALEERHPDFRQIAADPAFVSWREAQPENIQRLANSWDARETSVALTLYKSERMMGQSQRQDAPSEEKKPETAATDARRSAQLEGGREVRSKPAPATSGPPEDFDEAFKFFAAKRQAKA